jgi:hypothetical protein
MSISQLEVPNNYFLYVSGVINGNTGGPSPGPVGPQELLDYLVR